MNARLLEDRGRDLMMVWVREESGRIRCDIVPHEWVSFHKTEAIDAHPELRRSSYLAGARIEGSWTRLSWKNEKARKFICQQNSPYAAMGATGFEGDLDPVRRWLIDSDAQLQRPRRLYLDIETDSRGSMSQKLEKRVLCWGACDTDGNEFQFMLEEDTHDAERALHRAFWELARDYDQIAAWGGENFDFPVMEGRARKLGVLPEMEFQRLLWIDHCTVFKKLNVAAESGDEKQSYSLQAVGMHVLNEGKDKFDASKTWEAWEAGGEERARMGRYNMQDVRLMPRIEEKTGFLGLFQVICETCGIFSETHSLQSTYQMDGFMLRLSKTRDIHFPTKRYVENALKFKGAVVMEPKGKGILKNVHVGDFASLYPTIILTWNMSPETVGPKRRSLDQVPPGHAWSPLTYLTFDTSKVGILPDALREILALRKEWDTKKSACAPGTPEWQEADRRSKAYKVVANSFYGCLGEKSSRYYNRDLAESVAQCGVWLILQTNEFAEKEFGFNPVYMDTDSTFVEGCTQSEFERFVERCNTELYPKRLAEVGCITPAIKLTYEKAFARVVFVSAKRYIGNFLHYKGKAATKDSKPEIKGLEFKRGDTALLARRLQETAITMLLRGEEQREPYVKIVHEMLNHVLFDPLITEEFRLKQTLSQSLKEYAQKLKKDGSAASEPAHVRVARLLETRGAEVGEGSLIEYYVIDGSDGLKVAPLDDYSEELPADRYYLWEQKIFPPTQRLLVAAFPDSNWDEFAKVRPKKERGVLDGQMGLFGEAPRPVVATNSREIRERREEREAKVKESPTVPIGTVHLWADASPPSHLLAKWAEELRGPTPIAFFLHLEDGVTAELATPYCVDADAYADRVCEYEMWIRHY